MAAIGPAAKTGNLIAAAVGRPAPAQLVPVPARVKMPEPLKVSTLVGAGEPRGSFLVVDPGLKCGVAHVDSGSHYHVVSTPLEELPFVLRRALNVYNELGPATFVVCEDFHLLGGKARQQAGSIMPSSQGIGMCRVACEWTDTPLYLTQPGCKRAGEKALDAAGRAARAACRNDHERDVVDIAGFVLREMSRQP